MPQISLKPSYQVLPNNRLEKEFNEIAISYNDVLKLFLFSKYHVQNNHIYPKENNFQTLLSFCRTVFLVSMCIYRVVTAGVYSVRLEQNSYTFMFLLVIILFSIVHTFCFIMMFVLDIVHKYNNVDLILKIQAIYKNINFSENIRTYIIWNWISVLITISANIFLFGTFYLLRTDINALERILDLFCDITYIAYDINLIVAVRIIIFLRKNLDDWTKSINNEHHENNEKCLKLLEIYENILEAYNLYKNIFKILVSL